MSELLWATESSTAYLKEAVTAIQYVLDEMYDEAVRANNGGEASFVIMFPTFHSAMNVIVRDLRTRSDELQEATDEYYETKKEEKHGTKNQKTI